MVVRRVAVAALACLHCQARCGAERLVLDNGLLRAAVDSAAGLVELNSSSGQRFLLSGDAWLVSLAGQTLAPGTGCSVASTRQEGAAANVTFECTAGSEVVVGYRLPPGGLFVEKRLGVRAKSGKLSFQGATLFDGLHVRLTGDSSGAAPSWHVQGNPWMPGLEIAGFLRWASAGAGLFVSVANPWGKFQLSTSGGSGLKAGFNGSLQHDAAKEGPWLWIEPAVLGLTALSKYSNEGLNAGERTAFMRCVESYHLDGEMRAKQTVKVNVAWDENDYQIDVGTEEGRTQYRRIIDRNAELGVTHVVYEPQNSLHSSRFHATDGWGWEEALWFSMGISLRAGRWDPREDAVPEDILEMVRYAAGKGVKLLAYAYPTLRFEKMRAYFTGDQSTDVLSLAPPEVQQYFIDVMTSFLEKTGAAGYAWDHNIFAGDEGLRYAQWRGWMHILATLRARFPDLVMDHRQTAHMWGPWYQLAGSYDEPIAGDENPETYGVPITSLHTDHVAADNTRLTNYRYSTQQLIPPSRVPGFIFHQSERTDDDGVGYCTSNQKRCVNNSNTRDFDYLGYKYSLLSTIGTAGLNNVVTMIPARDPAEFELLPQEDLHFIRQWLAWTDQHLAELGNTQWIPTLPGPQLGAVDGTHAMAGDQGFVFLFNPNMRGMTVDLTVDESLGISNTSSGVFWEVEELYPRRGHLATWRHGERVTVDVCGSEARVLKLAKRAAGAPAARLLDAGALLGEAREAEGGRLEVFGASAPAGRLATLRVQRPPSTGLGTVPLSVNGVSCGSALPSQEGLVTAAVRFEGPPLLRSMVVGDSLPFSDFSGGWFNTTFSIPQALKDQLQKRARHYPMPWSFHNHSCGQPHCVDDSKATWLVPSRLLLAPFVANPKDTMRIDMWVDGRPVDLKRSYNSRGRTVSSCFLGFYWDASSLAADASHSVQLRLPPLSPGSFQGLFWENVETEYSTDVASCHVVAPGTSEVFV